MTDTKRKLHSIVFQKSADRQLNENKTRGGIDKVINELLTKARVERGWAIRIKPASRLSVAGMRKDPNGRYDTSYIYDITIEAEVTYDVERTSLGAEFATIVENARAKFAAQKWEIALVDGEKYQSPEAGAEADEIGYAPLVIPENIKDNFNHLYGLDAHISRVIGALYAASSSDWVHRFHCALIGDPGCGKSDICQTLIRALGEEAVMEFDATATTAAGALLELKEREELPRVLVVEEIEKAGDNSLQWLLSIMDIRGNIKKRTARGNIDRNTKMLVIATVNNFDRLNSVAYGALASRFSNKIWFRRPSRDLLERIVLREIDRVQGNPAWVAPTLDFAEKYGTTDPREVIALALCGRDGLLDGTYQKEVEATGRLVHD